MKTEFEFIETIRRRYNLSKVGDDCTVLPKDAKTDLVITTDLLVEDIDFRIEWTRAEFLGRKALAVSLSDVAAMGAKPVWAMLSVGIPEKIWKTDFVDKFYDGWFRLAKKFGVELIGGDVSRTPDKIVIDSIAAGETKKGKAVLRSGAKIGNLIFATGKLGGAAIALELLETGERYEKSRNKDLLLRQLAPSPQVEIGRILGEKNLATAMIDLSDGLSSDLFHLCRASKVGAKLFADKIPKYELQNEESSRFKAKDKKTNSQFAIRNSHLRGGEDFELLFTVNPKKKIHLEKALKNFSFSLIGEITANAEIVEFIEDKKTQILQPEGFQHF